jgi:hypothetical protein
VTRQLLEPSNQELLSKRARERGGAEAPVHGPRTRGLIKQIHRVASLIRNRPPLGPYSTTMPRALWWSYGVGVFLMSEVPLYVPLLAWCGMPHQASTLALVTSDERLVTSHWRLVISN